MARAAKKIYTLILVTSIIINVLLIPLFGWLWSLLLATTPEGFISNANIGEVLLKSPWVLPGALVLAIIYGNIILWQTYLTILGIGYIHQGKEFKITQLIRNSADELKTAIRPNNWGLVVYILLVVPFASIYQMNQTVENFVMPEYISQFIASKLWLWGVYTVILLLVIYLALRLMYIIPSFAFGEKNFLKSLKESFALTKKGWFKNGILLFIYNLIENIRFSIIPILVMAILTIILFLFTHNIEHSKEVYLHFLLPVVEYFMQKVINTLAYISLMCYISISYVRKKEGMDPSFEWNSFEDGKKHGIFLIRLQLKWAFTAFLICAAFYGIGLLAAHLNLEALERIYTPTEIIAHKGYSSEAPENTMPAFELAAESENVDFIELDVWNTADGIPVVVHNASIKAATGVDKYVYECTYEEIKNLEASYDMDPEEFPDARIPTLEEVLAAYADKTPLLIEIKGYKQDQDLPGDIVALMEKYNCTKTSRIHSGNYAALKAVKEINPEIKCGLIQAIVTGKSYNLPYADFFSVERTFVNSTMITAIHQSGKEIFVWTVNSHNTAEGLMGLNIDGVITDYPDDIWKILDDEELEMDIANITTPDIELPEQGDRPDLENY